MGAGAVVAGALLARAVEIVVARDAERGRGTDERVAELVALEVRDLDLVLDALEEGLEIGPAPAGNAPAVEILGLAADPDQAVDRGGAAQHLAARREHAPAVERRLGLGLKRPVD